MSKEQLIEAAKDMLNFSYTPYSNFKVGAALLCKDGSVYTGCNIENASFGPSICAERTAFFKAISEGKKDFEAIAIVGGRNGVIEDFCPPCGVCRQVMSEFCDPDTFDIYLANAENKIVSYKLTELMPLIFGKDRI